MQRSITAGYLTPAAGLCSASAGAERVPPAHSTAECLQAVTWLDEQRSEGRDEKKIWVGESPIIYDREKEELDIRSSYYSMGHFSKYIRRSARRIEYSVYDSALEACAFRNTDGSIVCVALNRTETDKEFALRYRQEIADVKARAHSIMTFIFDIL